MQTFLPYPDFARSAACLDHQRLGKQRIEAKQIYLAITIPSYGWKNHPAVKMWRGYETGLLNYCSIICKEWRSRGYKDTVLEWLASLPFEAWSVGGYTSPGFTDAFHLSHQSNLIRKLPSHYAPLFPGVPDNLPYVWPVK